MTSDVDDIDIEDKTPDTVNSGTKTLDLNQASGRLKVLNIPLTNFDNGVGGDIIKIDIELDVSGTAAGDVKLIVATLKASSN